MKKETIGLLVAGIACTSLVTSPAMAKTTSNKPTTYEQKHGATKLATTPAHLRGTWYSRANGKTTKLKITAHTINGVRLLVKGKQAPHFGAADEVKMGTKAATLRTLTKDGGYYLKVTPWYPVAGKATYYGFAKRVVKGHRVAVMTVAKKVNDQSAQAYFRTAKLAQEAGK